MTTPHHSARSIPLRLATLVATALVLATGLLGLGLRAATAEPRYQRIQIVHTNDLHGHVEHAATIADVFSWLRKGNPDTLILDAGDCITGTPLSTIFKGRPVFSVMSRMGYDAAVIGNHEFDHGWALIREFEELATFPLLCANARDPEGKPFGDAPYRIFEVGGLRVGVIGLVTDDVPGLTTRVASEGCSFDAPLDVARRLVPEVRAKCDIVVLLTHIGVEGETALAGAVEGVDLVVGGHSHTELKEPLAVGAAHVVQAGSYGRRVGVVDIVWDTEKQRISDLQGRLVRIDRTGMPRNADVQAVVDEWESRVEEQVGATIGKTEKRLDKKALRRHLERIYRDTLRTDFGYQNNGGIRANIDAGDIQIRDIWTVLPFDNTLVKLTLRGDQLPKYNRNQLGSAFDPMKDYVFATNSYVADQQKKYFGTTEAHVEDTGIMMRDSVVEYVERNGGFAPRGGRVTATASVTVQLGPAYDKPTDVTLTTTDGLELAATYHPPSGRPARGAPSVVALHMYRSDRTAWAPLVPEFAKRGMGVLAVDMRGHGGSAKQGDDDLGKRAVDRDAELFLAMHHDAQAGIEWLRKTLGVDAGEIGLIGASVGCSVSIDAAVRHAEQVGAVVTLTPGANYLGVPSLEHAAKWPQGKALLLVASEGERASGADALAAAVPTAESLFFPGASELHGTRMFGQVAGIEARLSRWMSGALAGVRLDGRASDVERALAQTTASITGPALSLSHGSAGGRQYFLLDYGTGGRPKRASWTLRLHTASGSRDIGLDEVDGTVGTASLATEDDTAYEALVDARLVGAKRGETVRVEVLARGRVVAPEADEPAIEWRVP